MSQPHLVSNCRISNGKGTIIVFLLQKSYKFLHFTNGSLVYLGKSRQVSTALYISVQRVQPDCTRVQCKIVSFY